MQEPQHLEAAATLLSLSEREFAGGYELLAAEALWGAAAHAVIARIQRLRGDTPQSHRAIMKAAEDLSRELGDSSLLSDMELAEKLHVQFYQGVFDANELSGYRRRTIALVEKLLSIE